jgi:hypothetical protein
MQSAVRLAAGMLLGAIIGFVTSYWGGASASCVMRPAVLCGLWGVFAAHFGILVAVILGLFVAKTWDMKWPSDLTRGWSATRAWSRSKLWIMRQPV